MGAMTDFNWDFGTSGPFIGALKIFLSLKSHNFQNFQHKATQFSGPKLTARS